jgi:hypothetical protein
LTTENESIMHYAVCDTWRCKVHDKSTKAEMGGVEYIVLWFLLYKEVVILLES